MAPRVRKIQIVKKSFLQATNQLAVIKEIPPKQHDEKKFQFNKKSSDRASSVENKIKSQIEYGSL